MAPRELRAMSRAAALSLSDAAIDALYDEHRALVDRKYVGGLTASEARHLELIRWKLNKVQMAEASGAFERLEAFAVVAEATGRRIEAIGESFRAAMARPSGWKRGR
jgi:hypothetical protein